MSCEFCDGKGELDMEANCGARRSTPCPFCRGVPTVIHGAADAVLVEHTLLGLIDWADAKLFDDMASALRTALARLQLRLQTKPGSDAGGLVSGLES